MLPPSFYHVHEICFKNKYCFSPCTPSNIDLICAKSFCLVFEGMFGNSKSDIAETSRVGNNFCT